MRSRSTRHAHARDRGAILPIVLVICVVLAMVVVGLATYASSGLSYGHVVESRADRLAAADGGIRYAVEELRARQSACTTGLGDGSGVTASFPPSGQPINGAAVAVTCQRIADSAGDTQGWAIVVTGGLGGSGKLTTQAGGEKKIGGRIFVERASTLGGSITVENGDVWYGAASCPSPPPSGITYYPAGVHESICTPNSWTSLFTAPQVNVPVSPVNPATSGGDPDGPGGLRPCVVYHPGKYTSPLTLNSSAEYYFRAGEYYFENASINLADTVAIAGYADGSLGDTEAFTSQSCGYFQDEDRADGGSAGATFYFGGNSRLYINKGEFEIMRRLQGDRAVSIHALDVGGTGYIASTLDLGQDVILVEEAGTPDFALHGLLWAPRTHVEFNIVGIKASGNVLGGIVIGSAHLKSSQEGLQIRVETNPIASRLMLTSTATIGADSTSIRAIAQVRPDNGDLVLNSWRVCETAGC